MNPWTDQGIFLLTFVDRLHGVQGGILRNLASIGLTLVFLYEESLRTEDIEQDRTSVAPIIETDHELDDSDIMHSSDESLDSAYNETRPIFTRNDESSSRLVGSKRPRSVDKSAHCAKQSKLNLGGRSINANLESGLKKTKSPLEDSSLSARVRRLRATTRGKALTKISFRIRKEWMETWPRRPSHMISIRLSELCMDSLSKSGEHKYALGLLLEVMSAVACDVTSLSMGNEFRSLYKRCASAAVMFFCALSHRNPTKQDISLVGNLARNLMNAIQHLKQGTKLRWDAPKIHNLVHYARSVRLFGRTRLTDTCEGETSMKVHKAAHERVASKDLYDCSKKLLMYMEHRDMTELVRLCVTHELRSRSTHCPTRSMDIADYSRSAILAAFLGPPFHSTGFVKPGQIELQGLGLPCSWFPSALARDIDCRFRAIPQLIQRAVSISNGSDMMYNIELFNGIKVRRTNESVAQIMACGNQGGRTRGSQQFDFVYCVDQEKPGNLVLGALYLAIRVSIQARDVLEHVLDLAVMRGFESTCNPVLCEICSGCSDVFLHCKMVDSFYITRIDRLAGRLTAFADVSSKADDIHSQSRFLVVNPTLFHTMEYYA
jgi:hypothetical protein